jgi:folylpolyglutamate synthase
VFPAILPRQVSPRFLSQTSDLNRLNIVHIAGTKGKGTTCAFVNSILQKYNQSHGIPRKIGLYTSPHLVAVRERIRINSEPISEEQFTRYFFEVWNALESSAIRDGVDPALKPSYFRFLTLMSFHVFLREDVDVAIYEVGVGGELDSTNVVEQPVVTGITSLGIDHVAALGDTIDKIAWHKAGIFKNGCPAFTVEQVPEAMEILNQRAIEKRVKLATVEIGPSLQNVDIKPAESFQRKNASLAAKLSFTVLEKLGVATDDNPKGLPEQFIQGLEDIVWRGRCEVIISGRQHWHLDGAHTEESLEVACSWFGRVTKAKLVAVFQSSIYLHMLINFISRELPRVLIFNQQSTRDAVSLLKTVHHTIYDRFKSSFQYALFCTNITHKVNSYKVGTCQVLHRTDSMGN